MEILRNKKFQLMAILFILFLAGIAIYAKFAGLLLILSLFVFGGLSIMWKEKEIKVAGLVALVLLALSCIAINGMKFGIDFSGGTRIPVILDHSVDTTTMNEMVQIIKKRANVLGLTEVKVRAVGDSEIDVEIPSNDQTNIQFVEEILSHQGVYEGIVDGQIAIKGDDVYSTSITPLTAAQLQSSGSDWGVGFSINKEGGEQFAEVAKGKANYPLYMFLDRPTDAVVFISYADFSAKSSDIATKEDLIKAANDAMKLDGGKNIQLYILEDTNINNITPATNKTKAIVSKDLVQETKNNIAARGFALVEFETNDFVPIIEKSERSSLNYHVSQWTAIGLLSAPFLSPGVTQGIPAYNYQISGVARSTGKERTTEIDENVKRIESVLKGGSLPVQITLGSRVTLPSSLGSEFLKLSLIGIALSLIVISILMGIRYMHMKAILPIIAISLSELIILLAILGSFTIDLSAMAGILAAIGVGVDAQIVITDEILKKDGLKIEEKMEHAFDIIKTNVVVAIIAMVPLLFSGIVEVIGFSISTILGALLGYLISRPAYAVIVGKILEE
ncbi:MAG: hypothetical protein WCT31_03870 [Candidatus Micrarchaeia archaeon]|jgi:preprotein translocase subunit SecD